jgi:hypothetical protein
VIRRTAEAHEHIKEELGDQRVVDQQFPRPPRRP